MVETRKALVERLFLQHGRGLRAFFGRRIPIAPDAAELAQEVYARLLRGGSEPIRNTEAYLYTVASNLVKEYRVRAHDRGATVDLDSAAIEGELAVTPGWAGELDEQRREARLREVLRQLPARPRAALILQYWKGLSYDEIARELGVSRRMVKRDLTLALAHCRRRMLGVR